MSGFTSFQPMPTKTEGAPKRGWVPRKPECWVLAESLIASGVPRVLLSGIPGTGKSYAARNHAIDNQCGESVVIYVRDDSAEFQIIGSDVIHKDGSSGWRNGPALIAMLQGRRLVVNEIDHASGDAFDALMQVCDDPESAGWTLPNGETVKPADGFQVIATMNGAREDLPEAMADRFRMEVNITYPHPQSIAALPEPMRRVAWNLSHAFVDESQRVPIRAFREFARAVELGVSEKHAAMAAFHNRGKELLNAMNIAAQDEPQECEDLSDTCNEEV